MAIWPFQGKNNHTVHVNSYFNLDELEYAFELSDEEGARVRLWRLEERS